MVIFFAKMGIFPCYRLRVSNLGMGMEITLNPHLGSEWGRRPCRWFDAGCGGAGGRCMGQKAKPPV